MRARTSPSLIEALRRLGAVRRNRTLVLGDQVYRMRRGRLVRIPDEFARPGGLERGLDGLLAGKRRKRWGRGKNGRMDWDTKNIERRRRDRLDRWNLRTAMSEWLCDWEWNSGRENSLCHLDDDYCWDDQEYAGSWSDCWWSITFPDLMR